MTPRPLTLTLINPNSHPDLPKHLHPSYAGSSSSHEVAGLGAAWLHPGQGLILQRD